MLTKMIVIFFSIGGFWVGKTDLPTKCFMTGENLQVNGGLCLRRNPLGTELFDAMVAAGEIPAE